MTRILCTVTLSTVVTGVLVAVSRSPARLSSALVDSGGYLPLGSFNIGLRYGANGYFRNQSANGTGRRVDHVSTAGSTGLIGDDSGTTTAAGPSSRSSHPKRAGCPDPQIARN